MRALIFAIITFSLSTSNAYAENNDGQFRSFLNGTSCAQLVNSLGNKEHKKQAAVMIAAFISGTNYAKERDSKIDLRGMALITEQFCRQNPKKPVTAALVYLDRAIDRRNELMQQTEKSQN